MVVVKKKPGTKSLVAAEDRGIKPTGVAKRKQRRHGEIPWAQMRTEYVEGIVTDRGSKKEKREWPTYKVLSERHAVNHQMIMNRASKERWVELKKSFEIKYVQEQTAKRAKRMAQDATSFDDRALSVAKTGMDMVQVRMGEIAEEISARKATRARALEMLAAGQQVDRKHLYSGINAMELERLANSLARFQEIGMKALGTDIDRHAILGSDGQIIDPTTATLDIKAELVRDDPDRTALVIMAMKDAGLVPQDVFDALQIEAPADEHDILDAEVVDEQHDEQKGAA